MTPRQVQWGRMLDHEVRWQLGQPLLAHTHTHTHTHWFNYILISLWKVPQPLWWSSSGVWTASPAYWLSLRSVSSYYKQQHHENLWLNMNRRADPSISNPGIERKPQTELRHQLLNIEISILSKRLFSELWTFGEKAQKTDWHFSLWGKCKCFPNDP